MHAYRYISIYIYIYVCIRSGSTPRRSRPTSPSASPTGLDHAQHISIYLSIYLSISISLSIYLSISIYIYLYLYLYLSLSIYLSIYLSISLSLSHSICIYKIRLETTSFPAHFSLGVAHRCVRGQLRNNYFTEMCSGSEEGSYLRLIDFCITQLYA